MCSSDLLTEADKYDNLTIHFNKKCNSIDIENNTAQLYDYETKKEFEAKGDVLFGADGAGSSLRKAYFLERKFLFSFSQNYQIGRASCRERV